MLEYLKWKRYGNVNNRVTYWNKYWRISILFDIHIPIGHWTAVLLRNMLWSHYDFFESLFRWKCYTIFKILFQNFWLTKKIKRGHWVLSWRLYQNSYTSQTKYQFLRPLYQLTRVTIKIDTIFFKINMILMWGLMQSKVKV